jgi:hypothetical protein
MKEFMLLIRNEADSKSGFSADQDHAFLKACEVYIENLKKNGNLQRAQPLIREGTMISGSGGKWNQQSYNEGKDVIVGYYHILAKDLDEAIALAKGNPEFAFTTTARIEVRPIKMREETTSYVYPKGG